MEPLHRELLRLPDLGVQPLDLPLMRSLCISPDASVEGARSLILKLLLPGVNLGVQSRNVMVHHRS